MVLVAMWGLPPSCVWGTGFSCPQACGNLSFPTTDWSHIPCIERWVLNHETAKKVLQELWCKGREDKNKRQEVHWSFALFCVGLKLVETWACLCSRENRAIGESEEEAQKRGDQIDSPTSWVNLYCLLIGILLHVICPWPTLTNPSPTSLTATFSVTYFCLLVITPV